MRGDRIMTDKCMTFFSSDENIIQKQINEFLSRGNRTAISISSSERHSGVASDYYTVFLLYRENDCE